ncbi:hypothetical protein B0H12DRAFT_1081697 [Mycena haematopus]|nr:hypothetical protein B0H12DRAFT_1081697 [Mycena haematopus]
MPGSSETLLKLAHFEVYRPSQTKRKFKRFYPFKLFKNGNSWSLKKETGFGGAGEKPRGGVTKMIGMPTDQADCFRPSLPKSRLSFLSTSFPSVFFLVAGIGLGVLFPEQIRVSAPSTNAFHTFQHLRADVVRDVADSQKGTETNGLLRHPSNSDSSALGRTKRKAEELDAPAIYSDILDKLRQHRLFSSMDVDDWEAIAKDMLDDPRLPAPACVSRPFTEAKSVYPELFDDSQAFDLIDLAEEDCQEYTDAAAALQNNSLWKGVQRHVVNQTSCRTAIHLVLITALTLAQDQISSSGDIDSTIRSRHSLTGPNQRQPDGREVGSWVVLEQKVDVPSQRVLPGISMHGVLDYALAVVPGCDVFRFSPECAQERPSFDPAKALHPAAQTLSESPTNLGLHRRSKARSNAAAKVQVIVQGAVMCVMRCAFDAMKFFPFDNLKVHAYGRCGVGVLPDIQTGGFDVEIWVPYPIDQGAWPMPQRTASGGITLPVVSEAKPFKAAKTPIFNIFTDLTVILRFLTQALLSSVDDFQKAVAEPGKKNKFDGARRWLQLHEEPDGTGRLPVRRDPYNPRHWTWWYIGHSTIAHTCRRELESPHAMTIMPAYPILSCSYYAVTNSNLILHSFGSRNGINTEYAGTCTDRAASAAETSLRPGYTRARFTQ